MHAVAARHWRGVIPHFRGCSGTPNLLPRAYHSGDSEEISWILHRLHTHAAPSPLYAAGVSLGGNTLLKWLGENTHDARTLTTCAAAVCPPLDLTLCGHALGQGFNRIYTRHFLSTLKQKALLKLERYPGLFDPVHLQQSRTLFEFDNIYTAPVHGYRDARDYWQRASSKPLLHAIRTPTLLLLSRNDSFIPPAAYPTSPECSAFIHLEIPAQGGHAGFTAASGPGYGWLPQQLLTYFIDNS